MRSGRGLAAQASSGIVRSRSSAWLEPSCQGQRAEGTVVAFAVDDIVGAREELAAAEVELIGDLVWADRLFDNPSMEGFGWFFFRGPDGNVYVMQQDGRPDST